MDAPHYFFKEGNIIPGIKERDQTDKVKSKGKKKAGGTVPRQAQRVMTAKLKKELVQRKQGGASPAAEIPHDNFTGAPTAADNTTGSASADSGAEAVEQVEQITHAAAVDVGHSVKQGMSRTIVKAKQERQKIKERRERPTSQHQPPDTPPPAPDTHEPNAPSNSTVHYRRTTGAASAPAASTPENRMRQWAVNQRKEHFTHPKAGAAIRGEAPPISPGTDTSPYRRGQMDTTSTLPAPTPEDRMRQRAVDQRKEQLTHPKEAPAFKGDAPASPHYGGPPPVSGPSAKNPPAGDQSIYPSIKERPRRSAVLKEKPQTGTVQPKTRRTVEQAARTRAAPTSALGPAGKEAATMRITVRAREKAQREAQRNMLQKPRQAVQATADLSKRAAQATVKAVKELTSALAALVGGGTLAAAMCVIFLVAAVIASPFGILFANEPSPGAVPLNAAVNQINMELSDKLAALQTGDYSAIDIQGAAPDWREVAAVFACKTAMGPDSVDVAALTPDRVERLRAVFWDMCSLTSNVETIAHPATDTSADGLSVLC